MIDSVRAFIEKCPFLPDCKINIDNLQSKAESISIDQLGAPIIVKKYACGAVLCQMAFLIRIRLGYGDNNAENIRLLSRISSYITEQSKAGSLPELGEGATAQKIEVTKNAYLKKSAHQSAEYQIECALIYYKKG
jgi:hypothetical protein